MDKVYDLTTVKLEWKYVIGLAVAFGVVFGAMELGKAGLNIVKGLAKGDESTGSKL